MKQLTMPVSEFKAKCLQLLKDVETKGDRIGIRDVESRWLRL